MTVVQPRPIFTRGAKKKKKMNEVIHLFIEHITQLFSSHSAVLLCAVTVALSLTNKGEKNDGS